MIRRSLLRRVLTISFTLFVFASCGLYELKHENLVTLDYEAIQRDVQNLLKNTQIVEIKESEINGVYEVYYNGTYPGIIYYYPEKHLFIFGEIWTVTGQSITANKREVFLKMIGASSVKRSEKRD